LTEDSSIEDATSSIVIYGVFVNILFSDFWMALISSRSEDTSCCIYYNK